MSLGAFLLNPYPLPLWRLEFSLQAPASSEWVSACVPLLWLINSGLAIIINTTGHSNHVTFTSPIWKKKKRKRKHQADCGHVWLTHVMAPVKQMDISASKSQVPRFPFLSSVRDEWAAQHKRDKRDELIFVSHGITDPQSMENIKIHGELERKITGDIVRI